MEVRDHITYEYATSLLLLMGMPQAPFGLQSSRAKWKRRFNIIVTSPVLEAVTQLRDGGNVDCQSVPLSVKQHSCDK